MFARFCVSILLWLEVSVDDAEAMKVIKGQSKLSQIELHILLSEHHLKERGWERKRERDQLLLFWLPHPCKAPPFLGRDECVLVHEKEEKMEAERYLLGQACEEVSSPQEVQDQVELSLCLKG